jgi:hypothetical protein
MAPTPERPALDPAQEERVRRMLADARHTEPLPTDVAERLDRVLAELAGQSAPGPTTTSAAATADTAAEPRRGASVLPLTPARRRRAGRLVLAAAAVVVVGFGATQVLDGAGSDQGSSSTGGSARSEAGGGAGADTGGASGPAAPRSLDGGTTTDPGPRRSTDGARTSQLDTSRVFRVRAGHFTQDVTRLGRVAPTAANSADLDGVLVAPAGGDRFAGCRPDGWGVGQRVPVIYAGQPGVLIFRDPEGETRVVDLFQCGSADVLRSVTLPVG